MDIVGIRWSNIHTNVALGWQPADASLARKLLCELPPSQKIWLETAKSLEINELWLRGWIPGKMTEGGRGAGSSA